MGGSSSTPQTIVRLSLDDKENKELYEDTLKYGYDCVDKYGEFNTYTKDVNKLFDEMKKYMDRVSYQENLMYALNNNPSLPVTIKTREMCTA